MNVRTAMCLGTGMTREEGYLDPSGLKSQCSYSYASSLKTVS
ncbi:MAG: hypothetical protein ACEY3L_13925 [Wolbachia sp.]|nr:MULTISPECIES: hypothetical protein [unclassified Wolbachia]